MSNEDVFDEQKFVVWVNNDENPPRVKEVFQTWKDGPYGKELSGGYTKRRGKKSDYTDAQWPPRKVTIRITIEEM